MTSRREGGSGSGFVHGVEREAGGGEAEVGRVGAADLSVKGRGERAGVELDLEGGGFEAGAVVVDVAGDPPETCGGLSAGGDDDGEDDRTVALGERPAVDGRTPGEGCVEGDADGDWPFILPEKEELRGGLEAAEPTLRRTSRVPLWLMPLKLPFSSSVPRESWLAWQVGMADAAWALATARREMRMSAAQRTSAIRDAGAFMCPSMRRPPGRRRGSR